MGLIPDQAVLILYFKDDSDNLLGIINRILIFNEKYNP